MTKMRLFALLIVAGLCLFWVLSEPRIYGISDPTLRGDPIAGETIFNAAGCAGCHSAPNASHDERLILSGGQKFPSPFGTFVAPNISMHPEFGIGAWSFEQFVIAVRDGVSPVGDHYYPAFPYNSYHYITDQDVADLWAFWQTLPLSDVGNVPHDLSFIAQWRRPLGFWKMLYFPTQWQTHPNMSDIEKRGHYLVQALGHCAECHTPRDVIGGLETAAWLTGGPSPDGKGKIPGITTAQLGWSAQDISEYLKSGFTPDYDVAGGLMAEVVENTSRLTDQDRLAIGSYLAAIK
jgi:mono/diheme cytochrome c family protein